MLAAAEGNLPVCIPRYGEGALELAVELYRDAAGFRGPGYFDELFRLELELDLRRLFGVSRFGGRFPELPRLWVNVDVHARGSLRRRRVRILRLRRRKGVETESEQAPKDQRDRRPHGYLQRPESHQPCFSDLLF